MSLPKNIQGIRTSFSGKPAIVWTITDPDEAEYIRDVLAEEAGHPKNDQGAADIVKALDRAIEILWGEDEL